MGKSALQQHAEEPLASNEATESEAQSSAPQSYDNTNTGAVFPTAAPEELDGPMNYHGKQCHATMKRSEKDGKTRYLLTVREGQTLVAQGLLSKSTNEETLKADIMNKPPRFRGVLKDAQDEKRNLPIALWFAHHKERASDYFQIRPDTQFVAAALKDF